MQLTEAIPKLSRNDRRLITRDPFLVIMSLYVVLIAVLARYGVPWLTDWLMSTQGIDLTPYYPLLTSLLILFPQFTGVVFGFLLLDERDQHTLDAMMVTPLPLRIFLGYRVGAAILLAFLMAMVTLLIYNPTGLTLIQSAGVCASAAVFSAAFMLFLASTAANKVEGFALAKIYGMVGMIPLVAFFIPEPWQFLFGFYPSYWTCKSVWVLSAGAGGWLFYAMIGAVTGLAFVWWLQRWFVRVAHR